MVSYSRGATGALGGAGTGAALGSIVPGIGTGLGAGIGGLTGGLAGLFANSKGDSEGGLFTRRGEEKRFDIYEPQQNQLLNLLQSILTGQGEQPQGGLLGSLLGEKGYEAFANPLKREFSQEIIPNIAERFSQLGAQRSSGFQNALTQAGADLSTRLGELRGQQQQNLLGPLLQAVLSPRSNVQYVPGGPTGFASGLSSILGGLSQGFGSYLGGKLL